MVASTGKSPKWHELWNNTIFVKPFRFRSSACNSVGRKLFFFSNNVETNFPLKLLQTLSYEDRNGVEFLRLTRCEQAAMSPGPCRSQETVVIIYLG